MSEFREAIIDFQGRLEKLPHAIEFPREGCSEADIRVLEEYAGSNLPGAYIEFLRVFGREKGRCFKGMSGCVNDRYGLHLREYANEVLERTSSSFRIPESSFVFTELQGYAFWLFPLEVSDNPPVFTIGEGEPEPQLLRPSFTEFLAMSIEELEELAVKRPAAFKPPRSTEGH